MFTKHLRYAHPLLIMHLKCLFCLILKQSYALDMFGSKIQSCATMASTTSAYWWTTQLKVEKFDYEWEITEFYVLIQDHYETLYSPVVRIYEISPGVYTYWNLNMVLDEDGFRYIKVSIINISYITYTSAVTVSIF